MSTWYEKELQRMLEEMRRTQQAENSFDSSSNPFRYTRPEPSPQRKPFMRRATPELFHDSYPTVPFVRGTDAVAYAGDEDVSMLVPCNPGRWEQVNKQKYLDDADWRRQLVNPVWTNMDPQPKPPRRNPFGPQFSW